MTHHFKCSTHGSWSMEVPDDKPCPVLGSCPACDADPWFNTDIDVGPYGLLGGAIVECRKDCAQYSRGADEVPE